jgi:hypothetical protein
MIRGIAPLSAIGLLILSGISILVLTLTATELLHDDDFVTAKVEWTPKLSTSAERLTSTTPLSAYQQTMAHPVFFKTRQPFVPPPPPPPPAPPQVARPAPPPAPPADPGLAVGGVVINGEVKKAYVFRKAADRTGSWVTEGDEIMGWKVHSINMEVPRCRRMAVISNSRSTLSSDAPISSLLAYAVTRSRSLHVVPNSACGRVQNRVRSL